jgi:hypothetical protein
MKDERGVSKSGAAKSVAGAEKQIRVFYNRFRIEHEIFSQQIKGLVAADDRKRYALLTLTRLMFLYFLQRNGFLAADQEGLNSALLRCESKSDPEGEHTFYGSVLRPLFKRGVVLNSSLFDPHLLESEKLKIDIPNEAFRRIFEFFDEYEWRLVSYGPAAERALNHDVLLFIFEQGLNQKQTGAYYTKNDIAEYIARNTILPFLLRGTLTDRSTTGWRLLRSEPDRYIFPQIRYGVIDNRGGTIEAPAIIATGLHDVSRREKWNEAADAKYALPAETWRDYAARRDRCLSITKKLQNGEINSVDELVAWNLDINRFARDLVEQTESPDFLRGFYQLVAGISVLDPTCGGGSFLFAALDVLQPLYRACLDRMEDFVAGAGQAADPEFRRILDKVGEDPNREFFIVKSILTRNLYGVDAMASAVELCRLRLYLKLLAQATRDAGNAPAEPACSPEIDFKLRVGNALVGYAENCGEENVDGDRLSGALDRRLYQDYRGLSYAAWRKSHQPFHWSVEFPEIIKAGGFDVVIGNPPYLEIREVDYEMKGFQTLDSGAIHAMCIERGLALLNSSGCAGMIVPLAVVSTRRMKIVQEVLENQRSVWYAHYSWRPGKLFDAVNRALTIFLAAPSENGKTYSTNYQKWNSEHRDDLLKNIAYTEIPRSRRAHWAPKCGEAIELSLLAKCLKLRTTVSDFTRATEHKIYYRTTGGLYWKVFTDFAPAFTMNGVEGKSTRETWFSVAAAEHVSPMIAALSSNTFWWWYTLSSTLRDLNPADIQHFPLPGAALEDERLRMLGREYIIDLKQNSRLLVRNQRQTGRAATQTFKIQKSKPIIDQIDRVLAKLYDFTEEETDFIINYDIKYRMGLSRE